MDPPTTVPPRQSFIRRQLAALGAQFAEADSGAVALSFGGDEPAASRRLGLADLSPLPRIGFKGRNVLPRLTAQGVELEDHPNRAFRQEGGNLAAVLARTEVLLLAPLASDATPLMALVDGWSLDQADGCYPAPRQDSHYWFQVTGAHAGAMFAKLCAVDLRPDQFPDLAIAQTSVARSNTVVIRDDLGAIPAFHLLGDSASAGYMWECLLDAMREFNGAPIGLDALLALGR